MTELPEGWLRRTSSLRFMISFSFWRPEKKNPPFSLSKFSRTAFSASCAARSSAFPPPSPDKSRERVNIEGVSSRKPEVPRLSVRDTTKTVSSSVRRVFNEIDRLSARRSSILPSPESDSIRERPLPQARSTHVRIFRSRRSGVLALRYS